MKPAAFEYIAPVTVEEALEALGGSGKDARVLGGGQSLVPMMNFRLAQPELLIDLNRISELAGIAIREDGVVRIGAMTRHRTVELSPEIRECLPLLHEAMPYIAHVQIRNRGTIGGSLAHADPAAEWPALCFALDATIVARSSSGSREIPATEFPLGILTTALEPDEIIAEVLFPHQPAGRRYGFQEISRRRGDFALTGVACTLDLNADGVVDASRIAIFGVDDIPLLSAEAVDALTGNTMTDVLAREAGRAAAAAINPRSDLHASSEYRTQLIETLVYRALKQAAGADLLKDVA
ncbi:FAD binding domain-containing protein [Peristeroidobacter soli]|uniref:FAD binding domain-containing protein n=1 Tax=Peristeroidobacter soli TaxID=2497877 RepID=UPI00101D2917|nr:xanthine dehydrogenase family protein subunit M [Peristeroidobacter soli]